MIIFVFQDGFYFLTDDDKLELELKTDLNVQIKEMIPDAEEQHRKLQQLIDDFLDQRVTKTDMKLRHIVSKGIEVNSILSYKQPKC